MSESSTALGLSRVIGFFAICGLLMVASLTRGLLSSSRAGLAFIGAQSVFVLCAAVAVWYLYQTKKAGWYLSLVVVLTWFLSLVSKMISLNGFALVVSVGMLVVLTWLFLPSVKSQFGVKF